MPKANIIAFQLPLPQTLPTIEGNVDYQQFRQQLLRIHELLYRSGLESQMLESELQRWTDGCPEVTGRAQQCHLQHSQRALRCNIARILIQEDFRGFAARLADSPLLQHFCGIAGVGAIRVPSKSTLQRYDQWWEEAEVRNLTHQLLSLGATDPEQLRLSAALDLENAFMDTTCLSAHIHYPVDWVLLRDATRTLMSAVGRIRAKGLRHRMEAPERFVSRINKLCIQMTHAGKKADGPRQRKRILRKMDRLVGTVRKHARRYRDLLDRQWEQTDWTRPQAEQFLRRIDKVLVLLPQARRQARQRILAEEPVANADKILSLYEEDIHVIVRGKAGAAVEFGNTLFVAENTQGLIIDWELFRERAPFDSDLLTDRAGRMEQVYGRKLKAVAADRGFDSQLNRQELDEEKIYNGVCPRDPQQLKERQRSWKFNWLQRRRAQTEGRIGIIKNAFVGRRMRSKGFKNRQRTMTWTILVHNLWVLARMDRAQAEPLQRQAA